MPTTIGDDCIPGTENEVHDITSPGFCDFMKEFQLETDVSGDGLGTILFQKQEDGHYHPVTYSSRGLKGGQTRCHSSKLEFLALKWAHLAIRSMLVSDSLLSLHEDKKII